MVMMHSIKKHIWAPDQSRLVRYAEGDVAYTILTITSLARSVKIKIKIPLFLLSTVFAFRPLGKMASHIPHTFGEHPKIYSTTIVINKAKVV